MIAELRGANREYYGGADVWQASSVRVLNNTGAGCLPVYINYEDYTDSIGDTRHLLVVTFRPENEGETSRYIDLDTGEIYISHP